MSNDAVRDWIAAEVRSEIARQNRRHLDAAAILGIHKASLSNRMRAKQSFRSEELAMLADWLDVPVSKFLPNNVAKVAV